MAENLKITVQTLDSYASANAVVGASSPSNNGPSTQETGLEKAIQTIQSKRANRIVVVDGIIDPSSLQRLAAGSGLAKRLLDPNTTAIRSSMLPSRPLDFLVARFITVGRYVEGTGGGRTLSRHTRDIVVTDCDADLVAGKLNGFARIRGFKLYGHDYFTVEQQTVFLELPTAATATSSSGGVGLSNNTKWSALLLNDAGGNEAPHPPRGTDGRLYGDAEYLPLTMRNFPPVQGQRGKAVHGGNSAIVLPRRPNPFDTQHMETTNHPPLVKAGNVHTSSLDFAANLLTTSALSWSQFLAFLRSNLFQQLPEEGDVGLPSDNNNTEESLRLLHQARTHLANAVDYFEDTLQFCKTAGHCNLSHASPSEPPPPQLSLVSYDFEELRSQALNVSALCKENIEAIHSKIALQQSQEALREGKRMALVTYLGATYAAIALSSSIFGMNVAGLGGSVPWYYFVVLTVAIGVLTGGFIFIFVRYGTLSVDTVKCMSWMV